MPSIIANVLTELGPDLQNHFHYPLLLLRLLSANQITDEEKAQVESGTTTYAQSGKLITILKGKHDSALYTILKYVHEDNKSLPHIEKLIRESAKRHGYFAQPSACSTSTERQPVHILPSKWCPERKELIKTFVYRTTRRGILLVEHLREILEDKQSDSSAFVAHKCVLVGMGGIGKTSVAKWYAITYEGNYDHVIWIDSDAQSLRNSLERLAKNLNLGIEMTGKLEHLAHDIYHKLGPAKCLFVFDNAESFDGLRKLLPKQEEHHSIITSRSILWGNDNEFGQIPTVQLDFFSNEECVNIFAKGLGEEIRQQEKDILDLAKELGFLPLALQTAIATIKNSNTRYTIRSYMGRIRRDIKFLVENKSLSEYEMCISATLQLSIEQIGNAHSHDQTKKGLCEVILNLAACTRPDYIPIELFLLLSSASVSEDEIGDVLDTLVLFSVLTQHNGTNWGTHYTKDFHIFSIHRLLQHVLLKAMERSDIVAMSEPIVGSLLRGLRSNRLSFITEHAVQVWQSIGPRLPPAGLQAYSQLPCVLAYYLSPIEPQIGFLEETVNLLQKEFGDGHVHVVIIKIRLAYAYAEEGRVSEARRLWEKVCKTVEELDDATPFKHCLMTHVQLGHADMSILGLESDVESIKKMHQDVSRTACDIYQQVLSKSNCDYNGEINEVPIYYNLLSKQNFGTLAFRDGCYQEMSFWTKVIFNYSYLLTLAGNDEHARDLLWEHFGTFSPEASDLTSLYTAYTILCPNERTDPDTDKRIHNTYDCAVKCILGLDFTTDDSSSYYVQCEQFWKIAASYIRYSLRDAQEFDLAAKKFSVLVSDIEWPPYALSIYFKNVVDILARFVHFKQFKIAEEISQIILEKILGQQHRLQYENFQPMYQLLRAILQPSTIYTYARLNGQNLSPASNLESAIAYDVRVLKFIRANIREEDIRDLCWVFSFNHDLLWLPGSTSKKSDLIHKSDSLITTTILKSKLSILVELLNISKKNGSDNFFSSLTNRYLFEGSMTLLFDEACYALVQLGELKEAKKLWTEGLELASTAKGDHILSHVLQLGYRTLSLADDDDVPQSEHKSFMMELIRITSTYVDSILQNPPPEMAIERPLKPSLIKWAQVFLSSGNCVRTGIGLVALTLNRNLIRELDLYQEPSFTSSLQLLRAITCSLLQDRNDNSLDTELGVVMQEVIQGLDKLLEKSPFKTTAATVC